MHYNTLYPDTKGEVKTWNAQATSDICNSPEMATWMGHCNEPEIALFCWFPSVECLGTVMKYMKHSEPLVKGSPPCILKPDFESFGGPRKMSRYPNCGSLNSPQEKIYCRQISFHHRKEQPVWNHQSYISLKVGQNHIKYCIVIYTYICNMYCT